MSDRQAALAARMTHVLGRAARQAHAIDQADKAITAAAAERQSALAPGLDGMRAEAVAGDPEQYADALVEQSRLQRLTAASLQ